MSRGGHGGPRRLAAAVLTAIFAGIALIGGAAPASAHASLIEVTPGDGEQLSAAPSSVVLTFSEPIDARFVDVVVLDAAEQPLVAEAPHVDGPDVIQPLPALPAQGGTFQVRFRVVSSDGHPIDGQTGFTVQAAAPSPSVPPASAPSATPADQPTETSEPAETQPAQTQPAESPSAGSPGAVAEPTVEATADDGSGLGLALGAAAVTALVAGGAVAARRRRTAAEREP